MDTQINSILVPTDFSELSESALKVGVAIAKRQNAKITLLHVIDRVAHLQPPEIFVSDVGISPDHISEIKMRLEKISNRVLIDTGVKVSGKVYDGNPSEEICSYAFKKKINLIVMGTYGSSGLKEFFIETEAFKVIKNAPCPVLTVPENWGKYFFEKVLFPIRLKPGAIKKYFYARPIIEKNNAELLLLGLADKKSPSQVREVALLVDRLKIQLHNDNIEFQSQIGPSNDFPSVVVATASRSEADLIVITANLEYDLKAYIVGPYTQQIVNHSRIPVLSIKPEYKNSVEDAAVNPVEKDGGSNNSFKKIL